MATVAWCRGDRIVGWPGGDALIERGPLGTRVLPLPFAPAHLHVTAGAGLVAIDPEGGIWHGRVGDAALRWRARLEKTAATGASFSADGGRVALAEGHRASVYETTTGRMLHYAFPNECDNVACALSADGRRLAVSYRTTPYFSEFGSAGNWGRGLRVDIVASAEAIGHDWDVTDHHEPDRPHAIVLSPDGEKLAVSDRGRFVYRTDASCEPSLEEVQGAFDVLAVGPRVVVASGPASWAVLGASSPTSAPGALALALTADERHVAVLEPGRIRIVALE
jgi:hypothetical protein